jgi:hypothetical protein
MTARSRAVDPELTDSSPYQTVDDTECGEDQLFRKGFSGIVPSQRR